MNWNYVGIRDASPKDRAAVGAEAQCQVPECSAVVARIATWTRGQHTENRRLCAEHAGDEAGRDAVAPKETT